MLEPHYPYLVGKEFNAEVLGYGLVGRSLFHTYQAMMKNIEAADYIIFLVTEPSRLSNRYAIPITYTDIYCKIDDDDVQYDSWKLEFVPEVETFTNSKRIRILRAVRAYYNELYSEEYHIIAQRGLLREIDSIIKEKKKKCIFLKCFENSFCDYTFKNAIWGNLDLRNISSNLSADNHLTEQNGKDLANFLIEVIKEDDFTPREINMVKYFK
tara:strand:- start:153 stop:788 length:636 start_codon:yes stop_codon:yes gene_type:complete